MKLTLPHGCSKYGAQMGRPNRIPSKPQPVKLRLQRLPMVDCGAYDRWGAYWGLGSPIYIAWSVEPVEFGDSLQTVQVFVRADNRNQAREKVLGIIPTATFYRS